MAGWAVIGVDAPAARLARHREGVGGGWARPGVSKWLKSKLAGETPPTMKMAPLPKGIAGKDAAHLEVVVYPPAPHRDPDTDASKGKGAKRAPAGKPTVLHALVVPDGSASWLVLAADEDLAVAKVKGVLAGTGGLAARDGLAGLKDAKINAGGFLCPRALAGGDVVGWTLAPKVRMLGDGMLSVLDDAPDRGMTPILFTTASQPPAPGGAGGAAGSFTATATIPKGAIEAFVRMALH